MSEYPKDDMQVAPAMADRSARAQFAYDEGRANARAGQGDNQNPFTVDSETEQHTAWQDGYGSHKAG